MGKRTRQRWDSSSKYVRRIRGLHLEGLEMRRLLAVDTRLAVAPLYTGDLGQEDPADLIATTPLIKPLSELDSSDLAPYHFFADGTQVDLFPLEGEWIVGANTGHEVNLSAVLDAGRGLNLPALNNAKLFHWKYLTFETNVDFEWDDFLAGVESQIGISPDSLWSAPVFESSETGMRQWVTDEVIVSLDESIDPQTFFSDAMYASYRPLRGTTDQFIATVSSGGGLEALRLANDVVPAKDGVRWATVNFISEGKNDLIPNDPLFSTQWNLHNVAQSGVPDADGDFPEAWDITTGDSQVVIAIVDSGVQTNHPDINMWVNPGEIAGNGVDDDGNGWIDDVNGINLADGNANSNDPNPSGAFDSHGTAVAGVAGARGNNSVGVAGGAFGAKIMAIKPWIENADGSFSFSVSDLTESIFYLSGRTANGTGTWRGADVSNHSYTVGSNSAITAAFDFSASSGRNGRGVPAFAATGNSASGYQTLGFEIDIPFNLFNSGAQVRLRYKKDGSVNEGDDAVWIANIRQPGGIRNRFDTFGDFEGWTSTGNALAAMTNSGQRQFGTGRHSIQMGSGALTHNQLTDFLSPEIEVDGTFSFNAWVSSEQDFDGLEMFVRYRTGVFGDFGDFQQVGGLISGVPTVTSAIGYPASLASTIAVGASTDFDYRSDYSQYGTGLDFVAPSGGGDSNAPTTDRTGAAGYDSGDYTSVSGTSFASPLAAAAGALLISRNPEMTAESVRLFLRSSADEEGGVTYDGNGFNQFYGHGRLDTDDALFQSGSDSNNQISEASLLTAGTTVNARLGTSVDVDMYQFAVSAGQTLGFDTDNLAGDTVTDLFLRLFNAAGNELHEADDVAGPAPEVHFREAYLEFTFPTSGQFFLGVSAFGNQEYNATTGAGATSASTGNNYQLTMRDLTSQALFVTQASDAGNGLVFDGVTLRDAITTANLIPGSVVTFDTNGVFSSAQSISLTGGQLVITASMTILGTGGDRLTINAQSNGRVFLVDDNTASQRTVRIEAMSMRNGSASTGAGIRNLEALTLVDSIVLFNSSSGDGGGIWNSGNLNIFGSDVHNNLASTRGGGIHNNNGATIVMDSTISGNVAADGGGAAIYFGNLTINRATISGNASGVWSFGNAGTTSTRIGNSIVSGNVSGDVVRHNNYTQTIFSDGFNIVGNGTAIGQFNQPGDQVGVDPQLTPFQNNGGTTLSYGLNPGSPAINSGDPSFTSSEFDQRGVGFPRIRGGILDIGAIEAHPPVVRLLGSVANGPSSQPAYNLRAGEFAFYQFDLSTTVTAGNGKSFVIDTLGSTLSGNNDTEIGLFTAAGNLVASDDDSGGGLLSRLSFGEGGINGDLPAGTYFLAISAHPTDFGATNFEVTTLSTDTGSYVVNFNLNQGGIDPDFNNDGLVNGVDIDLLQANIVIGPPNPGTFDLTGDGQVTIADRDAWLSQAGAINLPSQNPYRLGDANLDGVVDGQDFIAWNGNKFTTTSQWTQGDFNTDGIVDGQDFILWNGNKFQSADASNRMAVHQPATVARRHDWIIDQLFAQRTEEENAPKRFRNRDTAVSAIDAQFADYV